MTEELKLRECPFCGGPPDYIGTESSGYNVHCGHCVAESGWGDYGYRTQDKWNRRSPSPELTQLVKAARAVFDKYSCGVAENWEIDALGNALVPFKEVE